MRVWVSTPTVSNQMGRLFITAKPGYAFAAALGNALVAAMPLKAASARGYVASDPSSALHRVWTRDQGWRHA